MKKWLFVLAAISLFGCRLLTPSTSIESTEIPSQFAELSTATPYPTYTPYPTLTPYPTDTATPTLTPSNTPFPTSSRIKMGLLDYNGAEYYVTYDPSVWVSGKSYDNPTFARIQDLDCQILNHVGSGVPEDLVMDTNNQIIGRHIYSVTTWSWDRSVIWIRVYGYDEHISIQVRPGHDQETCIKEAEKVLELSQSTFYVP